ncbi:MAG: DUF4846 domain-containing protein [Bacteroidota bacterium]|nr:DUF4846 domain-containing protein [Bacteroidota bacterium]
MKTLILLSFFLLVSFLPSCNNTSAESTEVKVSQVVPPETSTVNKYSWSSDYQIKNALINRISVPEGYERITEEPGSFADWLRFEPLIEGNPRVHLYNGEEKRNQTVHHSVVNIDVGSKDLQQCADAIMRMRAEYLYSKKEFDKLHFNFTSGHSIGFKKWSEGYRTVIKGNDVNWVKKAGKDDSYKVFRAYCDVIFNYAGTSSLSKELKPVPSLSEMKTGDVFIVGGFPGHAVLVTDMCINKKTGKKLFLLQQSYMPAQEIHILKNYNDPALSPWYHQDFTGDLKTPEWTFSKDQLKRF